MAFVVGTDAAETLDAADGVTNDSDAIYGYGGNDTIRVLGVHAVDASWFVL